MIDIDGMIVENQDKVEFVSKIKKEVPTEPWQKLGNWLLTGAEHPASCVLCCSNPYWNTIDGIHRNLKAIENALTDNGFLTFIWLDKEPILVTLGYSDYISEKSFWLNIEAEFRGQLSRHQDLLHRPRHIQRTWTVDQFIQERETYYFNRAVRTYRVMNTLHGKHVARLDLISGFPSVADRVLELEA